MGESEPRPSPIHRAREHLDAGEPWRARDVLTAALAHARGSDADEILDLLGDVYAALGSEPHEIDQRLEHLRDRHAPVEAEEDPRRTMFAVAGLVVIAFVAVMTVIGIITVLRWMLGA